MKRVRKCKVSNIFFLHGRKPRDNIEGKWKIKLKFDYRRPLTNYINGEEEGGRR